MRPCGWHGKVDTECADDAGLERVYGVPTERTLTDYRQRRKEMLLALLDEYADGVDAQAEEIGRFYDHLRQIGICGFVAEHSMDPDFVAPAKHARSAPKKARSD